MRVGTGLKSILLIMCCIIAVPAFGVDIKKPNAKISELILGFGRDPQRAEKAALANASERAINGDYRLTSISISGAGDEFQCTLNIEHKIYIEEDKARTSEMTVGYGNDLRQGLFNLASWK